MPATLVPKLVTVLRDGYDRRQLTRDVVAGVVVGIVAIPLSIAFAIASGVSPERGLFTAIVGGLVVALLGGSRVQIAGPTGAFVVILYGIVQRFGIDGLTVATIMAGVMLVGFGLTGMGVAIRFIPRPLITGFTSGIAILIASSQVKDALGLHMGPVPVDFIEKWAAFAVNAGSTDLVSLGLTMLTVLTVVVWPRVTHRLPSPLVALLVTTAIAHMLHLDVATIGSRFGELRVGLPHFTMPHVHLADLQLLIAPAFTIALLGGVESLLSAVVSDGMIGGQHRSNMELVAQGIANIASPLLGGIAATGAIARSATNVKNGGRTPVSGIVHSLTVLLITVFLGRWAGLIPMATLAGILLVVAYQMSEWRVFVSELSSPRSDVAVLLVTFALTVFVDLTVAIEVGMVLASFLFMRRMAEVTNVTAITGALSDADEEPDTDATGVYAIPAGVDVYEINGPFFFGAAATFRDTLARVAGKPAVLILRMRKVPVIDGTGLHSLGDVIRRCRKDGTLVLLAGVQAQPLAALQRSALLGELGAENIYQQLPDALARAQEEIELRRLLHRTSGAVSIAE